MLAAGELHTVVLCGRTQQCPAQDELRIASLQLIESYAIAWQKARSPGKAAEPISDESKTRMPPAVAAAAVAVADALATGNGTEVAAATAKQAVQVRAALRQHLLLPPWNDPVPNHGMVSLELTVVFCKLVGLLDNSTDFQDVAASFSRALKQRAEKHTAAINNSIRSTGLGSKVKL